MRSLLEHSYRKQKWTSWNLESPRLFAFVSGVVWSFVSASLCVSVPFSMLRVVSSVSSSVSPASLPRFTLGYPVVLILATLLLYSGIRLKCNSNTRVSDWLSLDQALCFVQSAVVRRQGLSNSSGYLGSPLQKEGGDTFRAWAGQQTPKRDCWKSLLLLINILINSLPG